MSSDRQEQELRDRCSREKLVTVADFKRHPRQMIFRDEMMGYKGQLRLVLQLSGNGRYLTSKLSNIWMNRKV